MKYTVEAKKIIDDGELYIIESITCVPFAIKRVYTIKRCKTLLSRGLHAHKKTKQVLFCIQGSMDMILDNGKRKSTIHLNQPEIGVFIDAKVWHEMKNISKDAILLVMASRRYEESDYIRDYERFCSYVKDHRE